jgi:hypothetical protein
MWSNVGGYQDESILSRNVTIFGREPQCSIFFGILEGGLAGGGGWLTSVVPGLAEIGGQDMEPGVGILDSSSITLPQPSRDLPFVPPVTPLNKDTASQHSEPHNLK